MADDEEWDEKCPKCGSDDLELVGGDGVESEIWSCKNCDSTIDVSIEIKRWANVTVTSLK